MNENKYPIRIFSFIAFALIVLTICFPYSKTQKEFAKKCESVFHGTVIYDIGSYTAICEKPLDVLRTR